DITITQSPEKSFLAEVQSMMEAAENGRGAYVRIADRMARAYAPFVHTMAALAFIGWMIGTGGDWHTSLYIAIALLIITCPCALGLAVPVVHVIGAARLFENGILMKDGAALEKLAEIDHIVFDKTGTLTTGIPKIVNSTLHGSRDTIAAKTLASASNHPAARAVATSLEHANTAAAQNMVEVPGCGMQASFNGQQARLGRPDWVAEITASEPSSHASLAFGFAGQNAATFNLGETLRPDAQAAIAQLSATGCGIEIVSGDSTAAVAPIADTLHIKTFYANQRPADKIDRIHALREAGKKVLMVGDGINDAPALAAGHASMAPSSGSDVGRTASDFVFTRDSLTAVTMAHGVATRAQKLVKQNFALAFGYNLIAIPIAMAGLVTPLVAALAMSASSIVVVANSMRLSTGALGATPPQSKPNTATDYSAAMDLEPAE
ncbi:MAG: heavy metal translocating P-type ATPase, partial [Ahrensia sp.]